MSHSCVEQETFAIDPARFARGFYDHTGQKATFVADVAQAQMRTQLALF